MHQNINKCNTEILNYTYLHSSLRRAKLKAWMQPINSLTCIYSACFCSQLESVCPTADLHFVPHSSFLN